MQFHNNLWILFEDPWRSSEYLNILYFQIIISMHCSKHSARVTIYTLLGIIPKIDTISSFA